MFLRNRFSVVTDVQGENLVRCRWDVVDVGMLTSHGTSLVERGKRGLIRESVLGQQRLDLLLMFCYTRYQSLSIWKGRLGGKQQRILSYQPSAEDHPGEQR